MRAGQKHAREEQCGKQNESLKMATQESDEQRGAAGEALEMASKPEVRLQRVCPIRRIEPERIGAERMPGVGVDGRRGKEKLLRMLEVSGGVAQLAGVELMPARN